MTGIHATKWKILVSRLRKYIQYYGGWSEIFGSPFFNLAFILSIINSQLWQEKWVTLSQSLIPSMLGFSLGTYAILFSIISVKLKRALKEVNNSSGIPYLHEMNATFFHFIFVQVLAVMLSFVHSGTLPWAVYTSVFGSGDTVKFVFWVARGVSGAIGTMLVFYSLFLAVAAALIVYRLVTIVEPEVND